jgi:hypothetical protein
VSGEAVIATAPAGLHPKVGSTVAASAKPGMLHLFDVETEKSLGRL